MVIKKKTIEFSDGRIGDYSFISGDTSENGQINNFCLKTVGGVYHRYRLGHWWVPEMVLNVQSESSLLNNKLL